MNRPIFGNEYAEQYDLIYSSKHYEAECDFIEEAFRRYGDAPIQTVLDVGCGTGNHSIPLACRGYRLTGVDQSAAMLARAKRKVAERLQGRSIPAPSFLPGDMRTFHLGRLFDAVLMMFAGLVYQIDNDDVLATFRNVRRHLRTGGLFVSDLWYGPAVLAIRPSPQVKTFESSTGKLVRHATGTLDVAHHTAEIHFRLQRWSAGQPIAETNEDHRCRFFFPQELTGFLEQAGLALLNLSAFPSLDQPADETTWNAAIVARAV